ncbi:MAG TPA: hypothetical protein VGD98_12690 [Ktedonobacteraceae bacterium]
MSTAIITGLMPTTRTALRRVPGINPDHFEPAFLRFVFGKGGELRESPTVQFSLVLTICVLFATSSLRRFADVGEVFQYNSRA